MKWLNNCLPTGCNMSDATQHSAEPVASYQHLHRSGSTTAVWGCPACITHIWGGVRAGPPKTYRETVNEMVAGWNLLYHPGATRAMLAFNHSISPRVLVVKPRTKEVRAPPRGEDPAYDLLDYFDADILVDQVGDEHLVSYPLRFPRIDLG